MNEHKLTVGFHLTDEFGNEFSATSKREVSDAIYDSDLDFIGEQLNAFLKQCGYYRPNDIMMMESLTEEEYCALSEYLDHLRGKGSGENK